MSHHAKKQPLRFWVGLNKRTWRREVFAVHGEFKPREYRQTYALAVGPFGNARVAHFVRAYGGNAPAYKCPGGVKRTCHGKALAPGKVLDLPEKSGGSQIRSESARPYDVIDRVLDELGGIRRKPPGISADKLGEWNGYSEAVKAGLLRYLPPARVIPDEVAHFLDVSTSDAWDMLAKAAKARRSDPATRKTERSSIERAAEETEAFARSASCDLNFGATARPVRAGRLRPGDTFKIAGEPFVVKANDGATVTATDGTRFGLQTIPATFRLCVQPGTLKKNRASTQTAIAADPF